MSNSVEKIAVGGGCHWCTEAVFQALKGVEKVEQKRNQLAITTDGKTHYVDKVLVTSGRGAQWQNLNIEALGYDLNNKIIQH